MKYAVLVIAVVMYGLVIAFTHRKAWFTWGAALLVIALGVVDPIHAVRDLINWNVILIFIGGLTIADLFIYSRVPALIADRIVERAPSLGLGIVAILLLTGLLSAFVDNVSTVLVMSPIALALSRKVGMAPTTFMIGLAVMANLQGTATLVGDPPSMIFAAFAGYTFNDFFVRDGRLSIFFAVQVAALVGGAYFWLYFRRLGKTALDLEKLPIRSWFPVFLLLALMGGLALISMFFEGLGGFGVWAISLAAVGLAWFVFIQKEPAREAAALVKRLDWETILFLIGIFVVVGAVSETGLLVDLAEILKAFIGGNLLLGFIVIVLVSVLLSGFVDNVPYIMVMLPVAAGIARDLNLPRELYMFGLLIGSCMGGNLTPFGASANIVACSLVKKNSGGLVRFVDWLKLAGPFTLVTTGAASAFVWLLWR